VALAPLAPLDPPIRRKQQIQVKHVCESRNLFFLFVALLLYSNVFILNKMVKDLLLKVKVLTDQRKGFSVVQIRTSSQRTQQDQTETEL